MADENNAIDAQNEASLHAEQQPKANAETTNPQDFLSNFDWNKYEEGIEKVDET